MRKSLILAAAVLPGCIFGGVSENNFSEKFSDRYCEEIVTCNDAFTCDDSEDTDTEEVDTSDCTFDKDKAKECLDATWVCDDSLGAGFEFLIPDDSCLEVWDCAGSDTEDTAMEAM